LLGESSWLPRDRLRKRVAVSVTDVAGAHTIVEHVPGAEDLDINQLANAAVEVAGGGGVVGLNKEGLVLVVDNMGIVSTRSPEENEDLRLIGDASHLDLTCKAVVLNIAASRRTAASEEVDFFWSFLCSDNSCAIDSVLEVMTAVYTLMELDHVNRRALMKNFKHPRLMQKFVEVMSAQERQEPAELNLSRNRFRAVADTLRTRDAGLMDNASEVLSLLLRSHSKNSFVPLVGGYVSGSRMNGADGLMVSPPVCCEDDEDRVYEGFSTYSGMVRPLLSENCPLIYSPFKNHKSSEAFLLSLQCT
jgi:hypothetical protein